jgi:CBS domain-containing protein
MKLKNMMSTDVEMVELKNTLQEAAKKMESINAGVMPVVDDQRLVGMLTDRDITIRAVAAGKDPKTTKVGEVMTKEVVSCFEDQELEDAVTLMGEKQIRRMMILDRANKIVGVISLGDIATLLKDKEVSGTVLNQISMP